MNELLKEMGQRILERRKQLNMTHPGCADQVNAEMGQKAMRPETMLKICEALGISADYLLRGKILEADTSLLQQKISTLTPSQYRHLEQIIDSFIAAILLAIRLRVISSTSEAPAVVKLSDGSAVCFCGGGAILFSFGEEDSPVETALSGACSS